MPQWNWMGELGRQSQRGTKCYQVLPAKFSYAECSNQCSSSVTIGNASLACIRSDAENRFISENVAAICEGFPVWFGLHKSYDSDSKQSWERGSGCTSNFTNWGYKAPNKMFFTRSNCASLGELGQKENILWSTYRCNLRFHCLCEY